MTYDFTILPNGLKVIGLPMDFLHTVSVGLMVNSGSVYEDAKINGVSHFIEHMLFKGTETRSARQLACEIDAVGGLLNAFTDREDTCFYTNAVSEHLPIAMELIADMVLHSRFDPADIRKEKGVVLEEIAMAEDTPDDLVYELLNLSQYGLQKVSRPILGTEKTVKALTREKILGYKDMMYTPKRCVLALAGRYDWNDVVRQAQELYGTWKGGEGPEKAVAAEPFSPTVITREKDIEQTHIAIGWPCAASGDPAYYPYTILNTVVGGAVSSRLNQTIREQHGLAYNVYSSISNTLTCGQFSIYAGTSPEKANKVLSLMKSEMKKLGKDGVKEDEFEQAKQQTLAGIVMSLDSASSRMHAVGQRLLLQGDILSDEALIEKVRSITRESVNEAAREMLIKAPCAAIVGPEINDLDLDFIH